MPLKSRLSRLQAQAGTVVAAPEPAPAASRLHSRLAQLRPGRVQAQGASVRSVLSTEALAGELGGELITDGVIRICRRIPLSSTLGAIDLASLRTHPQLPGDSGSDTLRQVYIDTETTGLSGGSGTLAFLVGIAVVEDTAIALTQFLLTRFAAEAALLSAFAETLSPRDRLVSYNGKSYDLPLLQTRFRMQALQQPFDERPHLDLLHPVRRLFGNRWQDCRLLTLERNLLGFSRIDDLPGSEAPAAWFDYVRSGIGGRLIRVVKHNHQDIVSLAVAHSALARAIDQPRAFAVDLHALARWLAERDATAARELLQAHADDLCANGRRLLGQYCRRAGDWSQAVSIWKELAAAGCTDSLERLAKYHEHISKDLAAARTCCEQLPRAAVHEHRRQRIERKCQIAAASRSCNKSQ
jgi:uncharacterized protein YprB with RNaseH-like and TPR domain